MTKKILTIDPGFGGTGWAAWAAGPMWTKPVPPLETGVFTATQGDVFARAPKMAAKFTAVLFKYSPDTVYVEYPGLHSTASGMASAASGDIFKLMFLVGVYSHCCTIVGCQFIPLPVNDWKGTLSKEAVIKRIVQRIGQDYPNHTADAVGMGLHLKGVFNGTGLTRPKAPTKAAKKDPPGTGEAKERYPKL